MCGQRLYARLDTVLPVGCDLRDAVPEQMSDGVSVVEKMPTEKGGTFGLLLI